MKPDAAAFYLKLVKPHYITAANGSKADQHSRKHTQGPAAGGPGAGPAAAGKGTSHHDAEAEQALLQNTKVPLLWNWMVGSVCKGALVVPPAFRDLLGAAPEGGGRLCFLEMREAAAAAARDAREEGGMGQGTHAPASTRSSAASAAGKAEARTKQAAAAAAGVAVGGELDSIGAASTMEERLGSGEEACAIQEREAGMVLMQTARAARHGFEQVGLGSCAHSVSDLGKKRRSTRQHTVMCSPSMLCSSCCRVPVWLSLS